MVALNSIWTVSLNRFQAVKVFLRLFFHFISKNESKWNFFLFKWSFRLVVHFNAWHYTYISNGHLILAVERHWRCIVWCQATNQLFTRILRSSMLLRNWNYVDVDDHWERTMRALDDFKISIKSKGLSLSLSLFVSWWRMTYLQMIQLHRRTQTPEPTWTNLNQSEQYPI